MYRPRILFKCINLGGSNKALICKNYSNGVVSDIIEIKKILVLTKLSRYEFEQKNNKNLNNVELAKKLRSQGADFDKILHYYDLHKKFEENLLNTFKEIGVQVDVVNRLTMKDEHFETADVIMPVGGDGTFLLASSRVLNNRIPVVGFNSDPNRSEGHLCLPKKYSTNTYEVLERLQAGKFKWLMRSRIRTTLLTNPDEDLEPNYLYGIDGDDCVTAALPEVVDRIPKGKVLPVLALNEVFMGETLSARVSHLQVRLNGTAETTNLKSSGICVCTGTGSTSWHLSMNRLTVQSVAELLRLIDINPTEGKDSLATVLSEIYNKNLIFNPDDKRMSYTIRDLISASVWPEPKGIKSRSFVKKMEVRSSCFEASLVVDGGISFKFNDGAIALLEILPEDALRTVVFND